jgi:hypothetical protein
MVLPLPLWFFFPLREEKPEGMKDQKLLKQGKWVHNSIIFLLLKSLKRKIIQNIKK